MDHGKVLKRAWHILWSYRVLWVFGVILALTTFSGGGGGATGFSRDRDWGDRRWQDNYTIPDDFSLEFQEGIKKLTELFNEGIPADIRNTMITLGIFLACVSILILVVAIVARYVSETALIRMVDDYEETGEQSSFRQGLRKGWSRTALRLFLVDLLINIPAAVVIVISFVLVFSPLLLWNIGGVAAVVGTVSTIGLFFLLVFLVIIAVALLGLLKQFFRRAAALDGVGVVEAIRQGYAVVRRNLKDVGLMWLIMIGLRLGWLLLIVPIALLLVGAGALLGGLMALMVGALAGVFLQGGAPVIIAISVGVPIFIVVLIAPLVFLDGLWTTYVSSTWTLTYRELRALERLEQPSESELPEDQLLEPGSEETG